MANNYYNDKRVSHSMRELQDDPNWTPSLGEKFLKTHFRNGHWHAECDSNTGDCKVHYDKDDPHESVGSLIKHMADSDLGKIILVVAAAGIVDQILTGGQYRKSLLDSLN